MEQPGNVSEYWFLKYYRVLVIEENGRRIISVDVYKKDFSADEKTVSRCLNSKDYCILYRELDSSEYRDILPQTLVDKVKKVMVVGVKAKDKMETVNVRYIIEGDLSYSDIENLFYSSWKIIKCSPPSEEELP